MSRPARAQRHRQAAVAGIRALPFSKNIGMTERHTGGLAILGSRADAGLIVNDVDVMYGFVWETGRRVRPRFRDQAGTPLPCWTLA
jgi:hypothetical protein